MRRLFGTKKHPKGPDFRQARLLEFDLSGTKFRVKVPPHSETMLTPTVELKQSPTNIFDTTQYRTFFDKEGEPAFFEKEYIESWPFYGLPFIHRPLGRLGRMSFSVSVLKNTITGLNLFYPYQFEQFIHQFIDTRYKPPAGGWPESKKRFRDYRVPVDWFVIKLRDITWVSFRVKAMHIPEQITKWLSPISEQHAICISFNKHDHTKERCCEKAFQTLMDQITDTFEVELSEQSRKEKAEAEQRWPEARYSEKVPERDWSKAS